MISLAIIGVVGATSGTYLYGLLADWTAQRIESELYGYARSAAVAASLNGSPGVPHSLPPGLAAQVGAATSCRITFMTLGGIVLQDSATQGPLESHADRPEVRAALAEGIGKARRPSATTGIDMMYVAITYGSPSPLGIVRAAVPLHELDDVAHRVLTLIGIAAVVGLFAAVMMSAIASQVVSKELRSLVAMATELAHGGRRRLPEAGGQEVRFLAGSFNRLAESLERTVAELAAQRDRFETALGSIGEALVVVDVERRIAIVNDAAAELFDLPPSATGLLLAEAAEAQTLAGLVDAGQNAAATVELEVATGGPRPRRILAHSRPLARGGGTLIVASDVTEVRRLETVRRDFVANVSHELRTPVSIIRANSETLLSGALTDSRRAPGFVEAIHRNAERLSNLIADLLDLARIEAGHYVLQLTPVSPLDVVTSVVQALSGSAGRRRIEVSVAISAETDVVADEKALEQVVVNLVDNAIKYGAEGGRIEIVGLETDGRVRVEVRDDGPGIAPHHLERIFERFYRVEPGRSRAVGGTGLGLSIVKHLAEAMHGAVGVEPRSPTGSVFWVELPSAGRVPAAAVEPAGAAGPRP